MRQASRTGIWLKRWGNGVRRVVSWFLGFLVSWYLAAAMALGAAESAGNLSGMANTAAQRLEALETAYDAVVAGLATGRKVVEYNIGGRLARVEPSHKLLKELNASIREVRAAANAASGQSIQLVKFGGTSHVG